MFYVLCCMGWKMTKRTFLRHRILTRSELRTMSLLILFPATQHITTDFLKAIIRILKSEMKIEKVRENEKIKEK